MHINQYKFDYFAFFYKIIVNLQENLQLNLIIVHKILGSALFAKTAAILAPERVKTNTNQSGVLQIRPPQLLQLDQPPHGGHAHDVAYAHAVEDLPGGRRESQDHAAADRQLPLRPVAVDFVAAAGLVRRGAGRLLLRHPPHGDPVRPQCHFRRPDAAGHRQADAPEVAQRQRGGRQEPVRGGVSEAADEPERQELEVLVRQAGAPGAGAQAGGQHPEGLRRRLLGDRLQLPRHPLPRADRDGHHPRAHGGRRGVPLADALVVRALGPLHHPQAPLRAGTHRRHHLGPRHDPRGQPGEGDRRPRDLGQPALQDGTQPGLQFARGVRGAQPEGHPVAVEQPHFELHLRLQLGFPDLQQRRQPAYPLLPQHVPARRHFHAGDDRALHRTETQTIA